MKSRRIKIWIVSLLTLVLFCSASIPALAAGGNDIDWTKKGSITLTLKAKSTGEAVPGAELTLVQVAKAEESGGSLKYTPLSDFAAWSFDTPEDSGLPGKLAAYVSGKTNMNGVKGTTNDAGAVRFDNDGKGLELGLYLVMQTNVVNGYSTISPFLVMVPTREDGAWKYDVTGSPKPELDPGSRTEEPIRITVKKVWNDADRGSIQRPKSVTVQLMRGTAVVDTVTLQESNNWSHTWTELAQSSQWTVMEASVPEGYTASYERTARGTSYTYTVTNSAKEPDKPDNPKTPDQPKLPQTGQLNWPVPILAAAGMLFLVAGVVLISVKKGGEHA